MKKLSRGLTLSVAAGAVLYVLIAAAIGWRDVRAALDAYAWWTAAGALGLASTNYGLRFAKWEYYRTRLGIGVPRARSLGIFLAGFSLTVTPGKLGEVLKSYLLRESDGVPMAKSAPIVLAERVTDLIACLVLMLAGIGSAAPSRGVLTAAAVAAGLVVVLVAFVASARLGDAALSVAERLPILSRLAPKLREFHASSRALLAPAPLAVGTLISVVAWASECAAFWLVLRGFPQTDVAFGLATFIYASTTVAGAVSFLPGGLGVQEGGMIGFLVAAAGVARPTAVAVTFIARVCTLWYAVLVGVGALLVLRRSMKVDLEAMQEARAAAE